jgi:hypothetical protein
MKLLISALAVAVFGCAALSGETDGFHQRVERGCNSLTECENLQQEAGTRAAVACGSNSLLGVSCEDARQDRGTTAEYVREWEERQKEVEKRELERLENAQAQRREAARNARETRFIKPAPVSLQDEATPLEKWKSGAPMECTLAMNFKSCDAAPPDSTAEDVAACRSSCASNIKDAVEKRFGSAIEECSRAYVAADGKTEATCSVDVPASADLKGDGSKVNIAAGNAACAKACKQKGDEQLTFFKEAAKAQAQSDQIRLSYKRCMFAVDATPRAALYRLHDSDLYGDLMQKTDAACRVKTKCDWLEKYTDDRCDYGD